MLAPMDCNNQSVDERARRMRNALWGLFIGDALAMPAHWFYDVADIRRTFDGGVAGYADAPDTHPGNFMSGIPYRPDAECARRLGRPFDIAHEHSRFYETSYGGRGDARPEDAHHCHHGLMAGENTLGANLARVLMRSVIARGRFEPRAFLEAFVEFLTTPGENRDPYTETWVRRWFENFSTGLDPRRCAAFQEDEDGICANGGLVGPMVSSLTVDGAYRGLGVALERLNLTHRSENLASALIVLVPLLHGLLKGVEPTRIFQTHSSHMRLPVATPADLRKSDNTAEEIRRLRTEWSAESFEIAAFLADHPDDESISRRLSTACSPEHGLPLLLALAWRHDFDLRASLLANVNIGGDNVHRGMVLGLLLGAICEEIPADLRKGLAAAAELESEINAFVGMVHKNL